MTTEPGFGTRLRAAMHTHGPLCAGIDPHPELLQHWGLEPTLDGLQRFAWTCVEALAGHVAAVKPQSAFFEAHGSRGVAVLEQVVAALTQAGTLTILDVKRGDIGSTMDAYARAFLGPHAASPPDAITVSPYLGYDSLRPAVDLAAECGRGVFVLCLTSNPQGRSVQHARTAGRSVAGQILDGATGDNAEAAARGELGHVGLVVGATVGSAVADLDLDLAASASPILAPGLGAQGAGAEEVRAVFADALPQVLASSSRGILRAGPHVAAVRAAGMRESETLARIVGGR